MCSLLAALFWLDFCSSSLGSVLHIPKRTFSLFYLSHKAQLLPCLAKAKFSLPHGYLFSLYQSYFTFYLGMLCCQLIMSVTLKRFFFFFFYALSSQPSHFADYSDFPAFLVELVFCFPKLVSTKLIVLSAFYFSATLAVLFLQQPPFFWFQSFLTFLKFFVITYIA